MHFYKFHVNLYRGSTAHLTNEQDLAYRRLLDAYYESEKPMPLDTQRLAWRLRVDREALQTVLTEFFVETDAGWRHVRCDAEIEAYHQQAEASRENGKSGGRPKKPSRLQLGTKHEPSGNLSGTNQKPSSNLAATKSEPGETLITNNELLTTNQEAEETPATDARMCPPDWQPSRELAAYACGVLKELALNKEVLHFRAYKWRRPVQDWDDAWRRWVQQAAKSGSYAKQEWH